ncbi:hypothetical protein KIN34_13900 [Cellulomonas sp. DKR-3]|uniref:Integral membrane protein n=1 Tax=Cellulomonas fulva TaxID=2835530 RepID=A0ABS5U1U9_9CELL|nr:hypothetical protein [Cellulomonas fulva]MBT0995378.1 hypothetical protein [Cellulomonas fulva]
MTADDHSTSPLEGPTPEQARALLAGSGTASGALRAQGGDRRAIALTAFAATTLMFFAGLASAAPDDAAALVLIGLYVVTGAGLWFAFVRTAPVAKPGAVRRWSRAVGWWGAAYGVALFVGLSSFRAAPAYWYVAALVVAAPLAVAASREARA